MSKGLNAYMVVWTYIANHGSYTTYAVDAEEAAYLCFEGFSEDFQKKGRVYVFPVEASLVMEALDFEELKKAKAAAVSSFGNPWNMSPDYYCGFSSFRSYRSWFSGVLKKLAKAGFVLAIYEVPDGRDGLVKHGKKQVAFLKEEAKLVKKLSPLAKESEIQAVLAA